MAEFLCNPKTGGIPDTNGVSKAEEPIQGHTVVEPLNCRLYSEILKEFTDWYFSVSPENFDEGLLDAYLEEMEGLSPLESSFDSQASLEKFHERFSSFFETQEEPSNSEHPKRQASRLLIKINKLGIVAAIIVGIFGTLITAQAAGIDVFGAIGRWTEKTFHFVSPPTKSEEGQNTALSNSKSTEYFDLLQTALNECEITEDLVPAWYPEGFQAMEPVISKTKRYDTINVAFQGAEEQFFSLLITHYKTTDDLDLYTFEKDNSVVEQYTSGQKTFYILSNDDTVTATWSDGLLVESISGNLTMEEIKTIIDSIGG